MAPTTHEFLTHTSSFTWTHHSGSRFMIFLTLLGLIGLACVSSRKIPTSTVTSLTPLVVTVVVTSTQEPPIEAPSSTLELSDTNVPPIPTLSPLPPTPAIESTATQPIVSPYSPMGFVVNMHDGSGLVFYNLDGSKIAELVTPGLPKYASQYVHISGTWKGDLSQLPVAYFTIEGPSEEKGVDWLRIATGNSEPLWVSVSQFFAMAGATGQPVVAYSTVDYEETLPRSRLYAANLLSLPGASPLFVIADPDGYMVRPLAVDAEAGKLKGIWYTMSAYGIGGDIIFEPRKGMKYLDMSRGKVDEILNRNFAAWDISPDRNWVSYSTVSGPISVLNRRTGEVFTYPLLSDSNRGAGNAHISTDGKYVAWMEGSGWTMVEKPDLSVSIRIASTTGTHLADIPQTAFENIASSEKISWVEPAGWLDTQTLIVQVGYQEWSNPVLIRINYDGSNPLYLATGSLAAFLYP